jgi:hypothetical protein
MDIEIKNNGLSADYLNEIKDHLKNGKALSAYMGGIRRTIKLVDHGFICYERKLTNNGESSEVGNIKAFLPAVHWLFMDETVKLDK